MPEHEFRKFCSLPSVRTTLCTNHLRSSGNLDHWILSTTILSHCIDRRMTCEWKTQKDPIRSPSPEKKEWSLCSNKLCGKNGEVCYFEIECSHALSSIGRVTRLSLSQSRWISRGISCAGRVHTIKWSSMCIENSKNRTTFRVPLNELVAQPTSINFADSKVISSNQVNKHTDTMPFDTCTYESNHSDRLESDWLRHTFPILSTLCDCVWTQKVWSQWPFFCN